MQSCIYKGRVFHSRLGKVAHAFGFPLFMMWLDLAEIDTLFKGRWLWSANRPALARFRRKDHIGDPAQPLDTSVRDAVEQRLGWRPTGPIRLLTHLRYLGYGFNPVSIYFCYGPSDKALEAILLDVSNTPWRERHLYALDAHDPANFTFEKQFHVSPFMPMDMTYRVEAATPGTRLKLKMENWREGEKVFDVALSMTRTEITTASLATALLRFPLMTWQVIAAIHWHALRLFLKGATIFTHPRKLSAASTTSTVTGEPQS